MKRKKTTGDNSADPQSTFGEKPYRGNRKALQLCRQVQRALSYALSDCDDDVLAGLYVESVEPAPNDKHLMVTVQPLDADVMPEDVLARLHHVIGRLRAEVAKDIHRKKVPELSFRCIPAPAQ